jgi:hypothetical protein
MLWHNQCSDTASCANLQALLVAVATLLCGQPLHTIHTLLTNGCGSLLKRALFQLEALCVSVHSCCQARYLRTVH